MRRIDIMLLPQPTTGTKPRRRGSKPEQFTIIVEKLESLTFTVKIKNAQDLRLLVDGFENRLAILEDSVPAVGLAAPRNGGGNGRATS
jgi:hypothetical protein